ncbi:hypothetical protein [Legionella bozemanae]|nr:hypothetical protein [Legionella bozemanae]STO32473.1 Uncharacterised protein [Legionella bozemanae]
MIEPIANIEKMAPRPLSEKGYLRIKQNETQNTLDLTAMVGKSSM